MTSTIALLGHPVAHSISPPMQQAALDALGVDARYEAWDVAPGEVAAAVERLRGEDVLGANVTVPHKVELLQRHEGQTHGFFTLLMLPGSERGFQQVVKAVRAAIAEGARQATGATS